MKKNSILNNDSNNSNYKYSNNSNNSNNSYLNSKHNYLDVESNLYSLFSVLDIFNLDKNRLSELDDYLKIIGNFFIISKFGLTKSKQNNMIRSIKKKFKKLGLKSTSINRILDNVLNRDNNINLDSNIISDISNDPYVK